MHVLPACGPARRRKPFARVRRAWVAALAASLFVPAGAAAYSDRAGTDIVMDAPWRTVRDYIPVLFFFPQFEGGRRVERIRIVESVAGVPVGSSVVVDAVAGPDTLNGATFVGALGEMRDGMTAADRISSHWHYVVRIPHAALSHHGTPDVHDLRAEVEWTRPRFFGRERLRNFRVLRVIVDPARFPTLGAGDRYFDMHFHTIAEQTTAGVLDVEGGSKAFAAPLVMVLESAYAMGFMETRLRENGWRTHADSVATTDHNVFYSTRPYDAGVAPHFGPTAATDGHAGEAAWYRGHLGRLAGEEITLRRGSNQDWSLNLNLGHHLLAFGTRHFEGPWHGGKVLTSTVENPNTVESVLAGMKAAGGGGFAYSSHPQLDSFEWPPEYYTEAVGFPPWNTIAGPAVDSGRTEFLFKGAEVWNSKLDAVARDSGKLPASSAFDRMNPFEGGPAAQRFGPFAWDAELGRSLDTLFTLIGRGLCFQFREAPQERFIRKLYMIAGSDAHGDFNYTDEILATAVPYSGALNANAFGRVRTCALTHDRPAEARDPVAALAEGNAVITDGPVMMFTLDSNGRFDSDSTVARWHDGSSRWENANGRIGGSGPFDGGRTLLVASPGEDVWIRSVWKRSVTSGAGDIREIRFDRVMESARDSFRVGAGPAGVPGDRRAPRAMDRLCALVATARDSAVGERCITNPVWAAPVGIEIETRADRGGPAAILPPGSLRVVFRFPFSMSASAPTRAVLRPLDAAGTSTDPELVLTAEPGWETEGSVASSRLTVVNATPIAVPAADWDAVSHAPVAGIASFVVWLERPTDLHGNVLNDVARTFTVSRAVSRRQTTR